MLPCNIDIWLDRWQLQINSWFIHLGKKARGTCHFPCSSLLFKSAVPVFSSAAWRKIKLLLKSLSTPCQPPVTIHLSKSPAQIHINLAHPVQLMRELWFGERRKGLTHVDVLLEMFSAFKCPFFRVLYDIIPWLNETLLFPRYSANNYSNTVTSPLQLKQTLQGQIF